MRVAVAYCSCQKLPGGSRAGLLQLYAHQFCDQRPVLPRITPDADSVQPFQGMEVALIERKFLVEENLAHKIAITAADNVRIILAHGG